MAESSIQKDLRLSRERRKKLLAKRDASLVEKNAKEKAEKAVKKQKQQDLKKSMGSASSQMAARRMARDEGGKGQTPIPASEKSKERLATVAGAAASFIPVAGVLGKGYQILNKAGKVITTVPTQAAAKKVVALGKATPKVPVVNKNASLASAATKASPKVKTPSSKGLDSLVEGPPVSKNAGFANFPTKRTPVVKAKTTPPRKVAPSKLSKAGEARAKAKAATTAKPKAATIAKPKGKFTDIPTIGSKPPPRTTAPKPVPKPKPKTKAKPKATDTANPLSPASIASMIKKPSVRTASKVAAGVGAGAGAAYLLGDDSNKSSESTKSTKEPTEKSTNPQYDSTMDKSAGKRPKPSANLSDAFKANTEDGFNPLSPESMAKNKSEKSPKSKKKKDPHYKLYDNVLGKKLGMAGLTDAGYEAEEKEISEYKSGGKIKKLKHGGKLMKKSKGGFMGKGAGCARTGY